MALPKHKRQIAELLKKGDGVLVQATKDPMGTKGCRLTMQLSLAGRFVVYVASGDGLGVCRKLLDDERRRLRKICSALPLEGGLIVRTAAAGGQPTTSRRTPRRCAGSGPRSVNGAPRWPRDTVLLRGRHLPQGRPRSAQR